MIVQVIMLGTVDSVATSPHGNRLIGLVVKASALRVVDTGFKSLFRWDYSGSSHTCDLKIGTPVATLPGTLHYRVSAWSGWPDVSILWLGEMESLICNFYLSVAHIKLSEQILPWDTLACCWDIKQPTSKQNPHGLESAGAAQYEVVLVDGYWYFRW